MPKEVKATQKKQYKKTQPVRLYAKGVFTGFRRARMNQYEGQALVHVQHCKDTAAASFYFGKRVAYVYKVKNNVNNTRFRVSWGKVMGSHGNNGALRVKFLRNITAKAMGDTVRVMLYPNHSV